jgi:very-short-patch-repair endonuclease
MNTIKHQPTQYAQALGTALRKQGIRVELEHFDGHKHVDIHLPDVNINIEIDGLQHYIDPLQILIDFEREHYSDIHDLSTLHIPNNILTHHFNAVVDALAAAVRRRKKVIQSNHDSSHL